MFLNKDFLAISILDFLIIVIIGWILIALWQRSIDTFFYNAIGLNINSTSHTFMIALFVSLFFINFFYFFNSIASQIGVSSDDDLDEDSLDDIAIFTPLHKKF